MPRYRPETAKLKAKNLLKPLIKNKFNHSATARELGVAQSTISEQFHNPLVQETLAEYLNKSFNLEYIKSKFKDGLTAKRIGKFGEHPDLYCRHKYLVTLLECEGHLKFNGNGKGGTVAVIVNIRNPDRLLTSTQADLISPERE